MSDQIQSLQDLNQFNQRYAKAQQARFDELMQNPEVRGRAAKWANEEVTRLCFAHTESERAVLIRVMPSFEELADRASRELSNLKSFKSELQRDRAKRPRVKLLGDGSTMSQIVGRFLMQPQTQGKPTRLLWRLFFTELQRLELVPETNADDGYSYAYKANRRSIGYRHFANLVSRQRKKVSH